MDRIISKEEEREDPRRDSSIYLQVQNTVVFPHFYKNYTKSNIPTVFPHAIQQLQVSTINSMYRINSSTRNTTTTRHLPATVPRASKYSTRQNPVIRLLQHSRAIQHKQASSNSTRQKQHSTRQPASTQSLQQFPGQFYITEFY